LSSRIIHLCDRVAILINHDDHILNQRKSIVSQIRNLSGKAFDPALVATFESLAQKESFRLDLAQPSFDFQLSSIAPVKLVSGTAMELRDLAEVMAYAVDAKSRFTYRHSHGVAAVARFLAELSGFDSERRTLLEIAGLLHDLGKVTVPEAGRPNLNSAAYRHSHSGIWHY
jgi:response regulator RpfG family c-di-GMP phosphodiesterase